MLEGPTGMEEPDKKIHPKEKTMGMSDEGSDEEELHLLPRHTKVVVTGNNRTKTALVGQRGEVKKAVVRVSSEPRLLCSELCNHKSPGHIYLKPFFFFIS